MDHDFISIVISLASTYGIWLLASLLFVRIRHRRALTAARSLAHVHESGPVPAHGAEVRAMRRRTADDSFVNIINICECACSGTSD